MKKLIKNFWENIKYRYETSIVGFLLHGIFITCVIVGIMNLIKMILKQICIFLLHIL